MNSLFAALLLLPLGLLAPAGPGKPPAGPPVGALGPTVLDAAEVMEGVQRFYQSTSDFKATFKQTYLFKVYGRTQVSGGRVFFKKPGKMRWDYDTPVPKLFVSDGQMLWVYEPQESQAFRRSLRSSQLPVALTFMSGRGRLADEFAPKLLPPPSPTEYLLDLVPKTSSGDYQSLQLRIDRKTFAVVASTVVDPVGNTNTVEFTNFETNKGLPDKGFDFTPPAGVRVLEDKTTGFTP
jgi:outer membrane lipoprotein carrier protein